MGPARYVFGASDVALHLRIYARYLFAFHSAHPYRVCGCCSNIEVQNNLSNQNSSISSILNFTQFTFPEAATSVF